jgi:hypothetical protein
VPVPYFLLFLCFRKVTQEIFSELDKTKAKPPNIYQSFQTSEEETERGQGPASPPRGVAHPWSRSPVVRAPWSTDDAVPSPIKTPRREKPNDPINFLETHCDPLPSLTRDREGPEALPSTLPERGIATRDLLHRHACLRRDE